MNRKQKLFGIILISGLLFVGLSVLSPSKAFAATFVVDSVADDSDIAAGDGDCATLGAECTLRAAIEESEAFDGADTVNFNIPGAGVHTITPAASLPSLNNGPLILDASTQPGASCGTLVPDDLPATNTPHNLLIEINGQNFTGPAFVFNGTDGAEYTFRGFVVNGIPTAATDYSFYTSGDSLSSIDCNYFGTNTDGDAAATDNSPSAISAQASSMITNNLFSGFRNPIQTTGAGVEVSNNLFGTDASGTQLIGNEAAVSIRSNDAEFVHNVVVGSDTDGVTTTTNGLRFAGNYIGLGVDGNPLGNAEDGVEFSSGTYNYSVGGADSVDRNVIAANGRSGIHIYNLIGDSCSTSNTDSVIQGNYIGTNPSGEVADGYGNGGSGIEVNEQAQGSCGGGSIYRHQIGGIEDGQANTIAGNTEDGIRVFNAEETDVFSISMVRNKIYDNGNLGHNLAADPENAGEATEDVGPNPLNNLEVEYPTDDANNYLNAPEVDYFSLGDGTVKVHYDFDAPEVVGSSDELRSSDLVGFRLDFYVNDASTDGAYDGYSQAQEYLGGFAVDGSETAASHEFANSLGVSEDSIITATATILWRNIEEPECVDGERFGPGPPYQLSENTCD